MQKPQFASNRIPTTPNLHLRLAKIRVLIADHDPRTANLVHGVLRSFGFQKIDVVHNGQDAIQILRDKPITLLITEWEMKLTDGIRLVKAIRRTSRNDTIDRNLATIMLTAKADMDAVQEARDAGVTEFVAKPFSARTLSARLMQIIDNPRSFVISEEYVGPCRRRRNLPPPDGVDRRNLFVPGTKAKPLLIEIIPPDKKLMRLIGDDIQAVNIFTEKLIEEVQRDLQNKEYLFIEWSQDDIRKIEQAYDKLRNNALDTDAREQLMESTYSIKSQAGIFGYDLGTEVSRMLIDYMHPTRVITPNCLTVLRMHIDTLRIIFHKSIKGTGHAVAIDLLHALEVLVLKLG